MIDWLVRALVRQPAVPPEPLPPGVVVRRGAWIPWIGGFLARMGRPAAAVTLGRTIVVHPDAVLTPRLLRHELMHVRQWQRDRLVFPFRYAWYHLRYGYRNNPYEVEARRAEPKDSHGG